MESRTYPEIRTEILDRLAANPMTEKEILDKMKDDPKLVKDIILHMASKGELVFASDGYKLEIGKVREANA